MVKPIVSTINNLKTMGGGHTVYERQAILSTTIVISHTFCMENENELTPRGCGNNHVMLSCKSAISGVSGLSLLPETVNLCLGKRLPVKLAMPIPPAVSRDLIMQVGH